MCANTDMSLHFIMLKGTSDYVGGGVGRGEVCIQHNVLVNIEKKEQIDVSKTPLDFKIEQ